MVIFDPGLLDQVDDIASGVDLETAKSSLAGLGFEYLEPQVANPGAPREAHDTPHAWTHRAGILIGATQARGSKTLGTVRMGALVSFGWRDVADDAAFLRGQRWLEADGQWVVQLNIPLLDRLSMVSCLRSIHDAGAKILGFDHWAEQARSGNARSWMFVFGDGQVKDMDQWMDVPSWLGQGHRGLGEFVKDRIDRLHGSTTANRGAGSKISKESALRQARYVRKIAARMGLDEPTGQQSDKIKSWMGPAGRKLARSANPDCTFLPGGLNHGSLMAAGLGDGPNRKALMGWIETVPAGVLERVLLEPDATGQNLTSKLLESLVVFRQNPDIAGTGIGAFVSDCMVAIAGRVGTQAIERALHMDGTPIGQVMGFCNYRRGSNLGKLPQQVLAMLSGLEQAQVRIDSNAVIASFQPAPDTGNPGAGRVVGTPSQQCEFFASIPDPVDWSVVAAKLQALDMDAGTSHPRARPMASTRF